MSTKPQGSAEKSPDFLQAVFKKYRKISLSDLEQDPDVVDFSTERNLETYKHLRNIREIDCSDSQPELGGDLCTTSGNPLSRKPVFVYEHAHLPGFQIIPSLLSTDTQWELLSRLIHRDLADERYQTNVHHHYKIPYHLAANCLPTTNTLNEEHGASRNQGHNRSFFHCHPDSANLFSPIDAALHSPISIQQFLHKRLRWMTLGEQYSWTDKTYPEVIRPAFPEDIAQFVQKNFPATRPEAAIVNVYSPGDTLGIHRDVSEESNQGIVSISLGCDGLFVAGIEDQNHGSLQWLIVRLRSGDAIYMHGAARYCWHGVPQIIKGTCPEWLSPWPAPSISPSLTYCKESIHGLHFEAWRGWIKNKRVNLNVRQVHL